MNFIVLLVDKRWQYMSRYYINVFFMAGFKNETFLFNFYTCVLFIPTLTLSH